MSFHVRPLFHKTGRDICLQMGASLWLFISSQPESISALDLHETQVQGTSVFFFWTEAQCRLRGYAAPRAHLPFVFDG